MPKHHPITITSLTWFTWNGVVVESNISFSWGYYSNNSWYSNFVHVFLILTSPGTFFSATCCPVWDLRATRLCNQPFNQSLHHCNTLGIQSYCQIVIGGVQSPPKRIVFRFHYHSQKVIGSPGYMISNCKIDANTVWKLIGCCHRSFKPPEWRFNSFKQKVPTCLHPSLCVWTEHSHQKLQISKPSSINKITSKTPSTATFGMHLQQIFTPNDEGKGGFCGGLCHLPILRFLDAVQDLHQVVACCGMVKKCKEGKIPRDPITFWEWSWNRFGIIFCIPPIIFMRINHFLVGGFLPPIWKNMRTSNWIISPMVRGEHSKSYLSCHHLEEKWFGLHQNWKVRTHHIVSISHCFEYLVKWWWYDKYMICAFVCYGYTWIKPKA